MQKDIEERFIKKERKFTGNVVGIDIVTVNLPNGKEATRDVVVHPGGATIIPLSDDNCLYLVKQYRAALGKLMLELPAGKLDKGEEPLDCAKRELKEETGIKANKIKKISAINTTPGFCDETLHMYLATELELGEAELDKDEFLNVEKITIPKTLEMIENNEITDSKTIIGTLWAAYRV